MLSGNPYETTLRRALLISWVLLNPVKQTDEPSQQA
jgi:hypothetical protein